MENHKIIVLDRGDYTTCTINLQGATVTSWRIKNQEQLFVSRLGHSHELPNVKGGLYLIFPHFGLWSFGPRQGFVRNSVWVLEEGPKMLETQDIFVVLSLSDDAFTQALWGYRFRLLYKITLCENKLVFRISVENLGKERPFEFHIMQHGIFRVPDVRKCEITGLRYSYCKDLLSDGKALTTENKNVVTISGRINKLYSNIRGEIVVKNMMDGGTLKITRNNTEINLWNPGEDQSSSILDLGEEEYKNFISIKVGMLSDKVIKLQPMTSWMTTNTYEIVEQRADKKFLHEIYDFLSGFC